MELARRDYTWKLLLWSALIVMGHFVAVAWHLMLLVRIQPSAPGLLPPLLLLVDVIPIAALVLLAKGFPRSAGSLITVPLGTALVIGVYAHFLSPGANNILHMPPGPLTLSFQVSAVRLAILESSGCWVGIRMFTDRRLRAKPTV